MAFGLYIRIFKQIRRAKLIALSAGCLMGANPAAASSSAAGFISGLTVVQGRVMFFSSGSRTATPACHTQGGRWVINSNTAAGQAMIAVLLSLQAQGKQITVQGTDACPDWGDTETAGVIVQVN